MESRVFNFALSLLLLNSLILSSSTPNLNLTSSDQQALLAFKSAINIDDDGILSKNWSTSVSVCHWIGVSCGIKHGRVTTLNLSRFHLQGTLSPHLANLTFLRSVDVSVNSFTGVIPSWLGALTRLRHLHLNNNTFSGGIPPALLFNISTLQTLDIGYNMLDGNLPKEIGNSSYQIEIVSLAGNKITGSIPNGMLNMPSLIEINMRDNKLSGALPKDDMCGPKLKRIYLSGNQLSGQIPKSISKCKELEDLRLPENNFNGNIPTEIGSLPMLTTLSLWSNDFTGTIPKQIGNLTFLEVLSLNDNNLKGELPDELGNLAFLEIFSVSNNSLSGPIPSSIFNISTLQGLYLSLNKFSGSLPSNMGLSLFNLEKLILSHTSISGEIPTSITNASKLTVLEISNNSLSGSIPNFGNLRYLKTLFAWGNNLSGADFPTQELGFLSSLTNCPHLVALIIDSNPLNGILPTSIGNFSSLQGFSAIDCNIQGVIPPETGNLSNLGIMRLMGNQLTGFVPATIGNLKQLQQLYFSGNQLQGYIPNQLCQLSNLGNLYLDDNMLTGPIPECLGDLQLKSLRFLNLGSNNFNSTIPENLWNLRDLVALNLSSNHLSGQLSPQIAHLKAINIDMSSNRFSGDIPRSIEGCQSLESLNLSNNMFRGSIPQSLGKVRGLVTLDLSRNNLSGSIPESLGDLPFLQYLNVSHNKLEGKIPDNLSAQLIYFDDNSALCGAPRFQVPPCLGHPRSASVAPRLLKYIIPIFISAIVLVAIIIFMLIIRRRKKEIMPTPSNVSLGITEWRRVSHIELSRGTSSFSETNLLGRGSFGSVFKGTLADGLIVAVKVFNLQLERAAKNFASESAILSTIRHRNLVRVIGCCTNPEFKALILEYMANGSLDKWLYSENYYCLDLLQRLKIAIDVASALEHLHHRHTFPVVHCDIKPSNVLLDEDMTARICDFGMSKLFDDGEVVIQTTTLATIGYAAPEYGLEGKVSTNGDVYSYGIMLLEMFTGKKPMDDMFGEEMSIKEWVSRAMQENGVSQVVAPTLLSREDDDEHLDEKMRCLSYIFDLAMKCLAFSAEERINMMQVVGALHKIKALFPK